VTCAIGFGIPTSNCLSSRASRHDRQVQAAIDDLIVRRPELFDLKNEFGGAGTRQYWVANRQEFFDGVMAHLTDLGFCTEIKIDYRNGGNELLLVKNDNDSSETFDIILSSNHIRRGDAYRHTCRPASFPLPPDPNGPPPESGCGRPFPPPVTRWGAKIHLKKFEYWQLDSTPLVGPDYVYCAEVGFTDDRLICAVRPESHPERRACEAWAVGTAEDTGLPGPTWTRDGEYCTTLAASGCEHVEGNPFALKADAPGTYKVCAENGACGEVIVDR
jgi:hypothetical protein